MKVYILYYADGRKVRVEAETDLELVKKYDLATKENMNTKIMQIASY